MEDDLRSKLDQLAKAVTEAVDEVSGALESGEDKRQLDCGRLVATLSDRYQAILDEVDGEDRDRIERSIGRRIVDLRRSAQSLTRRMSGQKAERSVDAGFVPFLERRAPPKSIMSQRAAPGRGAPRYSVGGEVEAWCGKCAGSRTHHVVAMVGEEPKQVICQTCRSRHGFRTTPARAPRPVEVAEQQYPAMYQGTTGAKSSSPQEREAARRRDLQQKLVEELDAAVAPRPFNPKERYKAGEIIQHPEHGRGKIENVLRGSLLVRFREGLRPVNMH